MCYLVITSISFHRIIKKFKSFTGYRGCYSTYGLPSGPVYDSPGSMTSGFCFQVCQGQDPDLSSTYFMGIEVNVKPNFLKDLTVISIIQ